MLTEDSEFVVYTGLCLLSINSSVGRMDTVLNNGLTDGIVEQVTNV